MSAILLREVRVGRRAGIAVAIILALFVGRALVSRGIHPVSGARTLASAQVAPESGVTPTPSEGTAQPAVVNNTAPASAATAANPATETETATGAPGVTARLAEQVDGISDVDPHKAFGSKSAPVVVEIFSDYQCPACKNLFETTNRQLMDKYVSTGKVYLIHRDFPLPMHAYSRVAARYARAAAEVGKIETVEKALFDNQEKWEQTGDLDGTVAAVLSAAEMNKVRALVKGGTLEPLIDKDYQLGQMYRVNQTPTTVFHSKGQTYPYSGGMSWDTLRQFLDQLLSQK